MLIIICIDSVDERFNCSIPVKEKKPVKCLLLYSIHTNPDEISEIRISQLDPDSGFHGGSNSFLGVLALVLAQGSSTPSCSPVQNSFAVLVHFQLDNCHLAGVDAYIDGSSVSLLSLDTLDVDPEDWSQFESLLAVTDFFPSGLQNVKIGLIINRCLYACFFLIFVK